MDDLCRRKNTRRKAAPAANIDAVPDEILELVFLRLPSPLHLVRAASTCRRWRRVIAADGGRLLRSLYGEPSSRVVGHYRVTERSHSGPSPAGANPVFVPSSSSSPWADILAARKRSLALDFIPQYGHVFWELVDVRDGLLLVLSPMSPPRLLICDPLARRYEEIPPSVWFHGCDFMGVFLADGEGAGARTSLSNFRVSCAVYHSGVVRTRVFSSARGGRWTSGGGAPGSTVDCSNMYRRGILFAGCSEDGSVAYWTVGEDGTILALDKEAAQLSTSVMHDETEYIKLQLQRHTPKYEYKLVWPPTIQACLS